VRDDLTLRLGTVECVGEPFRRELSDDPTSLVGLDGRAGALPVRHQRHRPAVALAGERSEAVRAPGHPPLDHHVSGIASGGKVDDLAGVADVDDHALLLGTLVTQVVQPQRYPAPATRRVDDELGLDGSLRCVLGCGRGDAYAGDT
jgi:hypothetical protein